MKSKINIESSLPPRRLGSKYNSRCECCSGKISAGEMVRDAFFYTVEHGYVMKNFIKVHLSCPPKQ